jgi:hypothetical protein
MPNNDRILGKERTKSKEGNQTDTTARTVRSVTHENGRSDPNGEANHADAGVGEDGDLE